MLIHRIGLYGNFSYFAISCPFLYPTPKPPVSLTNDYIVCVYSVMALGCTVEDAEEYMQAVNQSSPVMEAIYGYGCSFGHPLNILKTTTTAPETTQDGGGGGSGGVGGGVVYRTGRHPSYGPRRSAGSSLHSYVSGSNPRRQDDGRQSSPNNCNSFFSFNDGHAFFFSPEDGLSFPGHSLVLACSCLSFLLQTFLLRDSGSFFREVPSHRGKKHRCQHGATNAFIKGNR